MRGMHKRSSFLPKNHTDTLVLGVSGWVVLSLPRRPPPYPDSIPSSILRNHTQRQCEGSRRSNDMFINNLILSILSDCCSSSRATSQFSQSVLSCQHLAASPGFKIKRQEGTKNQVCDSNPLMIRRALFFFWESLISVVSLQSWEFSTANACAGHLRRLVDVST